MRRSGQRSAIQLEFYALRPGELRPQRYRFNAPRHITAKSAAIRWGEAMRRSIEAGEPPPQSREGRARAAERAEPEPPKRASLTVAEAVDRYLADCEGRGNASGTVLAKRHKLSHVVASAGRVLIETAGEAEASEIRAKMKAHGYSVGYINAVVRVFAGMLRRCHALRLRSAPPEKLERVRERQVAAPKAYDDATFEALVQAAQGLGHDVVALILVAGEAALRVGELQGLEVRDIDLGRATLRVERAVSPTGELGPPKNGETRTCPLTPRLVAALAPLVDGRSPTEPVFQGPRGGRLCRPTVRNRLARVQALVGLPTKGIHVLRHSAAVSALTGGADVVAVQKLLGHRNLSTTVGAYLTEVGDAPQRAVSALAASRSAATPSVTTLARAPKTRPYASRRRAQK